MSIPVEIISYIFACTLNTTTAELCRCGVARRVCRKLCRVTSEAYHPHPLRCPSSTLRVATRLRIRWLRIWKRLQTRLCMLRISRVVGGPRRISCCRHVSVDLG